MKKELEKMSGVVVVDFVAEWCSPCKMMAPILDELKNKFHFNLIKIDTDADTDTANEFDIRSVPSVFIYKDGQEKKRFVGMQPKRVLDAALVEIG